MTNSHNSELCEFEFSQKLQASEKAATEKIVALNLLSAAVPYHSRASPGLRALDMHERRRKSGLWRSLRDIAFEFVTETVRLSTEPRSAGQPESAAQAGVSILEILLRPRNMPDWTAARSMPQDFRN
jgi:hypothetical protein